ncbi:MAG: hypothetical protein ACT6Q5_15860, partial [Sphingopyxis solisilvae]|uniref:hypothetical protein n=1 Tax=Sphingopyxis solisilvae TaxID=1886788 RepID=UPI0040356A47
ARSSFDSSVEGVERVCLWQLAFNQARRSLGDITSTLAPIRGAVRATANWRPKWVGLKWEVPQEISRGTPLPSIGISAGIASPVGQVISCRNDSFKPVWYDN